MSLMRQLSANRDIYRGELPLNWFDGTVYSLSIASHSGDVTIIRVHHVQRGTLLMLRIAEQATDQYGAYWTWTRVRMLTPAEWVELERRIDAAGIWNLPTFELDRKERYGGYSASLELYDGERHRFVGRANWQTPAFWDVVRLMQDYARCSESLGSWRVPSSTIAWTSSAPFAGKG